MQRNFIFTIMGILAMIMQFLSCITPQHPSTNQQQMKELKLIDAEIKEIVSPERMDETIYQLSFKYERKLLHAVFYYQQHSGIIEEADRKKKCQVKLTKKHHQLPRSIYPLLTQGYIVVQFSWLGLETYQVIKEFKILK
ncbi:MAG: hypothetical protein IPM42_14440 [Saprospiraceae bacterium]|nr:hypothetical protein [Saprospiraceae bacterium]